MATAERVLIGRTEGVLVALEGSILRQMVALERITPVPRADATLLGLISVGGEVVPLLDLGRSLGLPSEGFAPPYAAVVEVHGVRWALALEEVLGFFVTEALEPLPQGVSGLLRSASLGQFEHHGSVVYRLNLNALEPLRLSAA